MAIQLIIVALTVAISAVFADITVIKRSQESCEVGSSCMGMSQCFDLLTVTGENMTADFFLFSCSDVGDRVCCPTLSTRQATLRRNPDANKKLLPLETCGSSFVPRISGGQVANLGQFPWMTLIAYRSNRSSGGVEYRCGGSLISSRYVLTAAHCMNYGSPVSVRLGEHDLSTEADCEDEDYCADPPVDVEVEKVTPHKDYNRPLLKNDIALLRLRTSVAITDFISTICLPFDLIITGQEMKRYTVAGWGKVERKSHQSSSVLRFASVRSTPVTKCNRAQPIDVRPIGDLQLCAGDLGNNDVCNGDSGGPMMESRLDATGNVKTYQTGIVSFGYTSCGGNTPSVYTRVSAYLPWILSHLEP